MAEWLRRWTRNPMGIARAGSNPARSVFILVDKNSSYYTTEPVQLLHVNIFTNTLLNV